MVEQQPVVELSVSGDTPMPDATRRMIAEFAEMAQRAAEATGWALAKRSRVGPPAGDASIAISAIADDGFDVDVDFDRPRSPLWSRRTYVKSAPDGAAELFFEEATRYLEAVRPGRLAIAFDVEVEKTVGAVQRLLDQLEELMRQLSAASLRIEDLEIYCEQLEAQRNSLVAELRRKGGANPRTSRPAARAAGAVALAVASGLAGGWAQAKASAAPVINNVIEASQQVHEACSIVVVLADRVEPELPSTD